MEVVYYSKTQDAEAGCLDQMCSKNLITVNGGNLQPTYTSSLAGHTLSQERVWYFTTQRFVPDPMTFVGWFPPNIYVACVLRDRMYTLQPLSARTISCTVTYQTLSRERVWPARLYYTSILLGFM